MMINNTNIYTPADSEKARQAQEQQAQKVLSKPVTMDNVVIRKYKNTVEKFFQKAKQIEKEKQNNNERYRPETANEENAVLQAKFENEYLKAKQSVRSTYEDARTALSMAAFPNPESVTADKMFFDGSVRFNLTENEMKTFVQRYVESGNFTMLRMIADYINEVEKDVSFSDKKYVESMRMIHFPSEQLGLYKSFAESAVSLIDTIYTSPSGTNELLIDSYAEKNFCMNSFEIVGTGNHLADYKSYRLPESAKHMFDDVTLSSDIAPVPVSGFDSYSRLR